MRSHSIYNLLAADQFSLIIFELKKVSDTSFLFYLKILALPYSRKEDISDVLSFKPRKLYR